MLTITRGRNVPFQVQHIVTSVASFHRTAVIMSLTVQRGVSIVLHKLNCLQPMSWCSMCFSCHSKTCIHPSRHSSTSTWQSGCCSLPLVAVTQYFYKQFLDFSLGNFRGDFISGIGYLLPTHLNACTIPDEHYINTPVTICSIQNKQFRKNFNNRLLQMGLVVCSPLEQTEFHRQHTLLVESFGNMNM